MSDQDTIGFIASRIEALADAALDQRGYYLLSELGKDLGPALNHLKLITKQGLGNFIRDRFPHKFTVVVTGEFKNVLALIRSPTSAGEPEPVILFSEPPIFTQRRAVPKATPRFNYRFWAAFSVPLQTGRRFLSLLDFRFRDFEAGEVLPEDWVEVPAELIAATDIPERDKQIVENIYSWIAQNDFDPFDFYQSRTHKGTLHTVAPGSVLEALITALDHRQLSSTSLSLDVVAALFRKKI